MQIAALRPLNLYKINSYNSHKINSPTKETKPSSMGAISFCANPIKPVFNKETIEYQPISSTKPNYDILNCDYSDLEEFCTLFADKINSQMMQVSKKDIEKLITELKVETKASDKTIKEVLYQLSLYSNYDTMDYLQQLSDNYATPRFGLQPKWFYGPSDFSTNAMFNYLADNKSMIKFDYQNKPKGSIVVLDSMFIEELKKSKKEDTEPYKAFVKLVKNCSINLVNLRGWDIKCEDGKYRNANFMIGTGFLKPMAKSVLKRILQGEKLDDILYKDLEDDLANVVGDDIDLSTNIKRKAPKYKKNVTTNDILNNLKRPKIDKYELYATIEECAQLNQEKHGYDIKEALCRYLDETMIIYSPETMALGLVELKKEFDNKFDKPEDIVYATDGHGKSQSYITSLFAKINDIPLSNLHCFVFDEMYLTPDRFKNVPIVMLDDVSGSGKTIFDTCRKYGRFRANDMSMHWGVILTSHLANSRLTSDTTYNPDSYTYTKEAEDLVCQDYSWRYSAIGTKDFMRLHEYLDLGFQNMGMSCAFPHIIPDNNSTISAKILDSLLIKSTRDSNKRKKLH